MQYLDIQFPWSQHKFLAAYSNDDDETIKHDMAELLRRQPGCVVSIKDAATIILERRPIQLPINFKGVV